MTVDRKCFDGGVVEPVARMLNVAGFEQEAFQSYRRGEFEKDEIIPFRGHAPEKSLALIGALDTVFLKDSQRR